MNILDIINEIRKEERVTLEWLAMQSGVSRNTITGWFRRDVDPTYKVEKVLNALGYELEVVRRDK